MIKVTVFALLGALAFAGCASSDEVPTADEAGALIVDLPADQCVVQDVLADGTVVEVCCLEGEAYCPATGREWYYTCRNRPTAIAQCAAECGYTCPRWEGNSCEF